MAARHSCLVLIGCLCCVSASLGQEPIFSDGFEWGSTCAWSNDLWYPDGDVDLFGDGDAAGVPSSCPPPSGMVDNNGDCDDGLFLVNPGQPELCDELDNDCEVATPDGSDETWFGDNCDGLDSDHCEEGTKVCSGGSEWCDDTTGDILDWCNGMDDDCNVDTPDGSDESWYGVPCDGPDDDACEEGVNECVGGAQWCSDTTGEAVDEPDDSFMDSNCDGIDGDVENSLFVAADGQDGWPGTMAQPKQTIAAALSAAGAGTDILVSAGTYAESLTLLSGVDLYGGYSRAQGWERSDDHVVQIQGSSQGAFCDGCSDVTLDRIRLISSSNAASGGSSYGLRLLSCSSVTVRHSVIEAGSGAEGEAGASGSRGDDGLPGDPGSPGCENQGYPCDQCDRPSGGSGGDGCGDYWIGGDGGDPGLGLQDGDDGLPGVGGASGGLSSGCSLAYCGGSDNFVCDGDPGSGGGTGTQGAGGLSFNTALSAEYLPSSGGAGVEGDPGGGGGGGAGGDGGAAGCDSYGSSGGGGGGGGCGGTAGGGGTGGAGSFAIWAGSCAGLVVESCTLITSVGGAGGDGGEGGLGGNGGEGGAAGLYGGEAEQDDAACGGHGGDGDDGGDGGAGGGGGGGPSIGIVTASCTGSTFTGNTFNLGPGGDGGTSSGNPGATGLSTNTHSF